MDRPPKIRAFSDEREIDHFGKWIIVYNKELAGTYDSFELATEDAVKRFGRGPYLIRKVGAPPITLPASVLQPCR